MDREKISNFINQSDESTQKKLDAAWSHFSENCEDIEWIRQIGNLLHGKRKAKKLFGVKLESMSKEE